MKPIERIAVLSLLLLCAASAFAANAPAPASKGGDPNLALARVNGEPVTAGDLLKLFTDRHSGHAAFLGGESEARSFLNIVIDEALLTQEAYNLGLDEEDSVAGVVREYEDQQVSAALVKSEITDKVKPSQADLEAGLRRLDNVLQVRQIALATRAEAEEVRAAILRGADAQQIARDCSGARSSRNGGNVMVAWGQFEPAWEEAVLSLEPGDVSPVIETNDGYEVVQVVNRVEVPPPDLASVSEQLSATLLKRNTAAREKALSEQLWTTYHCSRADVDFSPLSLFQLINQAPQTAIVTWDGGGKLTLGETFNADELRQILALPPVRARNEIDKRIRMTVNSPLSILEGRARRLQEAPDVAAKIDEYREFVMKNLLFRDHIFADVKLSDEAVRKFYETHGAEFTEASQYHVAQVMVASEKDAVDIRAKLAAGASFDDIVTKFSRDPISASTGGDLGWVKQEQVPKAFAEVLAMKPGDVSKPVPSPTGAWHLIKLLDKKPERLPPLDEIRDKVGAKALEFAKREERKAWVDKLRAASEIEIDSAAINQFVLDHKDDGSAPPPQHAMQ